ncbi:MAG: hypothetical protein IKZ82_09450, partial [Clostridia bacterium]|nr:hypothetical protein [Clostridia bacterium]
AHDYGKCAEFLEQTDENGVKNGEKLSAAYDVNDPSSWGNLTFQWAQRNGEMRIWNIALWQYQGLVGRMDMSNCSSLFSLDFMENDITEVDVSGCRELMYLDCSGNELTELDVSDSVDMLFLYCDTNRLTSLDVSMLTDLEELDCYDNGLTELDVSNSPNLEALYCTGNLFTELDLSNNPKLGLDLITVDGSGHIGYRFLIDNGELHARPANGASFEGFFNENGDLLDEGFFIEEDDAFVYYLSDLEDGDIIARFSGGAPAPVPGDVDGNGSVTVSDAVTALRIAMELFDGNGFNLDNADMDGNESITIADAVVILRIAMGLA